MKRLMMTLALAVLGGCGETPESGIQKQESTLSNTYPETRESTVTDIYFGTEVADPYRWLEDDRSEETAAWVARQNEVTFGYLERIPWREQLEARITELMNYERVSAPRTEGRHTYFYRNSGLQDQDVVYRQQGDGEPEVFLDPNRLSEDGTTSLASLSFSENGRIAAYTVSEAGSDWRKAYVIDVETREVLELPLVDLKFTGLSWRGNEGFYYSRYEKPEGSELSAKTDQHMVYFHRLGEAQSDDELVFGATAEQKHRYVGASVSEDDRFLTISASQTTSGNKLFVKDLSDPGSPLLTVVDDEESDVWMIANEGDRLILYTNRDAPNGRVVSVPAGTPSPDNWQVIIPETENVLVASSGGGYLFAEYMVDALSRIYQHDYEGKRIREISLPGPGSASTPGGKRDDDVLYYSFTNYVLPSTIFALDVSTGASTVYRRSSAPFESENYVSNQVFYTSKDGTRVPMLVSHRRDIKRDGSNPTMLYGYGGFNVSLTPGYSTTFAAWMEQGGVVAVPNLRGGGEYGKAWHLAGTLFNKQNVFDDFIAAGEYLINEKYTSSEKLVLRGGSNGGLLVGAVMTQRPDLAAVALPAVGVLDMLRYHTFTAGAGWAYDYGTAEQSKEMFEYLRDYSPLHNLEEGVAYPATLVTTSDHDDRVVPAHSFKFAATLQQAHAGNEPVMIRIETSAGHGAGKPVSKQIEGLADELSFAFFNAGHTPDRLAE